MKTVNEDKKIIIIAGPNGTGKATLALEYLPKEASCPVFVNADLRKAGTIFSTFTNNWLMPGFSSTTQEKNQDFLMKEKRNEQSQNANS